MSKYQSESQIKEVLYKSCYEKKLEMTYFWSCKSQKDFKSTSCWKKNIRNFLQNESLNESEISER